jgi:hypothetical protein
MVESRLSRAHEATPVRPVGLGAALGERDAVPRVVSLSQGFGALET